ncbi:MAG: FHA domain-containing protein [Planctomycetota bacterium]
MAYKLTLILSGRTLARHEFADDAERVRIGRSPECEVTIDNLGVSRTHCEIVQKPGYFRLKDMESGNGTFVNGARVTTYNLNHGDVISLGKFTLRFEAEDQPDPLAESDAAMPIVEEGSMTLAMDAESLAKKHRQQATKNRGYFVLPDGRNLILDKELYSIGADADADLEVKGWFAPRVAAIVIRGEQGFRLYDVSPNGRTVAVNGRLRRDAWLNDNDEVRIRKLVMRFHRGVPVGR